MTERRLDVDFCRAHFPPLQNGWIYFENAGGSYVPRQVIDHLTRFMSECQCQPAYPFAASREAARQLENARNLMAESINADADEIVIGPSTTLNVYVLANALRPLLSEGDEIVVTNQDHEANSGAWRRFAESGITVREWRIDAITGDLNHEHLASLLSERTRLVCFPHVSNIVGSVNDVRAISKLAHEVGAMVCVDGVATTAHALADVKDLDVDFYLYSLYKLFGPHLAVLYGKREHLGAVRNQNHFFLESQIPATLNPGGLNYESTAALPGIVEYLDAIYDHHFDAPENRLRTRIEQVFGLFATHESTLMSELLAYLRSRCDVRLIGRDESDPKRRAPTVSLVVAGKQPAALAATLAEHQICVGSGHFYGYRCVEGLGIDPGEGVLRISMVHYNTVEEVDRLKGALDVVLG